MKPRFVLPALAAIAAAGGAFYTLQAQDARPKNERKFHLDLSGNLSAPGPVKEHLRQMLDRLDLQGEARQQFEQALDNWTTAAADDDDDDGADQSPAKPKQFRYEFRNDGSG
ncbi:MAG TPA: hypothetical protein VHM91_16930, partial [Verrucomicrobiales bacterium]|nr:hypothetical protein [Verrucomicrobiales bacterium]